jgi:hypothetical protein
VPSTSAGEPVGSRLPSLASSKSCNIDNPRFPFDIFNICGDSQECNPLYSVIYTSSLLLLLGVLHVLVWTKNTLWARPCMSLRPCFFEVGNPHDHRIIILFIVTDTPIVILTVIDIPIDIIFLPTVILIPIVIVIFTATVDPCYRSFATSWPCFCQVGHSWASTISG